MHIGLDLGTSGLKAIAMTDDQKIVAQVNIPLCVARPASGWSEQAPQDWIAAADQAMNALMAQIDLSRMCSIGLSGQMHGAVLVDAADRVLRNCILWNDTRSHVEAAAFDADPQWRALSGNIVFPGFTAPKLAWVARHEPEIFEQVAKVLLPKDYLRLWLTGEHVAEMSDAAGTSWLDTGARDWSEDLLRKSGLSRAQMPRLVEGSEVSGRLRSELAGKWGVNGAVVVAGGAGDNAASAVGMGVVKAGQSFVSLGTSGVLFAANDGYHPDPARAVHTFCHALPDTWHQMGVILAATDALNWYGSFVGSDPVTLTRDLGALQAPGAAMFLPFLGGERTPHNSAALRAGFIGLDHNAGQEEGTRAVMEGVAYALADSRDALAATGTTFETCLAVGGGAQSEYWLALLASTLGFAIQVPKDADVGAALGAARLGMMAHGGDISIATPPQIAREIEPDRNLAGAFAEGHARYKAAAQAFLSLA